MINRNFVLALSAYRNQWSRTKKCLTKGTSTPLNYILIDEINRLTNFFSLIEPSLSLLGLSLIRQNTTNARNEKQSRANTGIHGHKLNNQDVYNIYMRGLLEHPWRVPFSYTLRLATAHPPSTHEWCRWGNIGMCSPWGGLEIRKLWWHRQRVK